MADNPANPHDPTQPQAAGRRDRAATVTLNEASSAADAEASLMDPAAKSLADALRITFRLLQAAMVILVVLFLFSGMQSVKSNEQAIRVTLGRIERDNLEKGFQFSWPYPFGELVKIQTNAPSVVLQEDFFPNLSAGEAGMSVETLAGGGRDSLDPITDGSLITADGFIVHLRAGMQYSRTDPATVAGAMLPDDEAQIVRAAARRGLVHAAASVNADRLLSGDSDDQIRLAAMTVAQQTLDSLNSGLTITSMTIGDRMPPRRVATEYRKPLSAVSDAAKAAEEASTDRQRRLNSVAGAAAEIIIAQIDKYEEHLNLGRTKEAAATLAIIDSLLTGETVEIDGRKVVPVLDGEVSSLLRNAELDRQRTLERAAADAARFRAIRTAFAANPAVVINSEWAQAYRAFVTRSNVQVQILPASLAKLVVMINRDPTLAKEQVQQLRMKEAEEKRQEIMRMRDRERFNRRVDPSAQQTSQ